MPSRFQKLLAMVLAAALFCTGCSAPASQPLLAEPTYPSMAPYPDEQAYFHPVTGEFDSDGFSQVYDAWREDQRRQLEQPEGYADGLSDFFREVIPVLLSGSEKNPVCSPLNLYMALSLLAQTTSGSSLWQILDTLNADSADSLRAQAAQVWNAHYHDDTASVSVLANSLWLDEGLTYREDTVQTLAEDLYTSVFRGDLGSPEMNQALQTWLSQQTGGLLDQEIKNVTLDPNTVLALASTIYYRAKWRSEFSPDQNTDSIFHAPDGDVTATFMHKQLPYGPYFWGEDFTAAYLTLEDGSKFWMVLPDEGKTPSDVLESGHALDLLLNHSEDSPNQKSLRVNLSLPKFDITADTPAKDCLQQLGITDVFSPDSADFSAILPDQSAWLDRICHTTRVAIDEEGIAAAAYTVMMVAGAAMPPEDEVDLILDRPFLFVITSRDDLPLFTGIVTAP